MVAMDEASLAARREARRLGIAIAAMMPIIATTMRSSINEKPSWRLLVMLIWCSLKRLGFQSLAPPAFRSLCEPRRARCVAGLLNNRYAKPFFAKNGGKAI